MGKAGIVGGVGPASTLDYYREIISGFRRATGGKNLSKIVVKHFRYDRDAAIHRKKGIFPAVLIFSPAPIDDAGRRRADFCP